MIFLSLSLCFFHSKIYAHRESFSSAKRHYSKERKKMWFLFLFLFIHSLKAQKILGNPRTSLARFTADVKDETQFPIKKSA